MDAMDRYFIERKYHDPEQPFNAFKRRAYHGIGYIEDSGLDDAQLQEGLAQLDLEDLPHPVARAKALAYLMDNSRLYINEHDYFVGLYSLDRLADPVTFKKWEKESRAMRDPTLVAQDQAFNASGAVIFWPDYDHVVPDWQALMELGIPGLRRRAADYCRRHEESGNMTPERKAFFAGIDIQYAAMERLCKRFAETAKALDFSKAEAIAVCMDNLSKGAPTDIYEAMQLMYVYFIVSECIDSYQVRSLGNGLDRTLLPFYEKDLASGRYTKEEIRQFLAYFMLQWSSIGNYWGQPFYLGGTKADGATRYNELSMDILEVYDRLEIYNPKIQLKLNQNTPEYVLRKAFDMVRRKNASLVFCCEPGMTAAVMSYGATEEEAWDFDIRGCYETGVRGDEVSTAAGHINAAKAVEYVFTNGFDRHIGKTVGLAAGDLSSLTEFEAFYKAFLTQWGYLIDKSLEISMDAEKYLSYVNPSAMYSATVETSLQRGEDGYGGGVRFNNTAVQNCAFASAVDSLMAVKEFVYERKLLSLQDLAKALGLNWEGCEALRRKVMKSCHKYGSADPETDALARKMSRFFVDKINGMPNSRGGVHKAILHSARAYITQGATTGALPDGRLSGTELSKNADPVAGMEKKGVTGILRSAVQMFPEEYREAFCLDIMLHPSTLSGDNGFAVFKGLLMMYLENKGQAVQFNLFDANTLKDAQKNPEKYKSLQVRVCGWNVLWNDLSKDEQDAYILRSENLQ